MTEKEFMNDVYNILDFLPTNNEANEIIDSFDKFLNELEQESYEDDISRQAVLEMLDFIGEHPTYSNPYAELEEIVRVEDIMTLPPVTPQLKIGKWIDDGFYAEGYNEHAYRCSECDKQYIGYVGDFKYCPNCGLKMEAEE